MKLVLEYVNRFSSDFERYLYSEKEFYIPFDEFEYKGIVDLVLDIGGKEVEIVDFKTLVGPMKDFELQMSSYAMGIEFSYGLNVRTASVHFLSRNRREKLAVSPSLLESMEQTISRMSNEIRLLRFPFTDSDEECKKCDFKVFCPGSNRNS